MVFSWRIKICLILLPLISVCFADPNTAMSTAAWQSGNLFGKATTISSVGMGNAALEAINALNKKSFQDLETTKQLSQPSLSINADKKIQHGIPKVQKLATEAAENDLNLQADPHYRMKTQTQQQVLNQLLSDDAINVDTIKSVAPHCMEKTGKALRYCIDQALKQNGTALQLQPLRKNKITQFAQHSHVSHSTKHS